MFKSQPEKEIHIPKTMFLPFRQRFNFHKRRLFGEADSKEICHVLSGSCVGGAPLSPRSAGMYADNYGAF